MSAIPQVSSDWQEGFLRVLPAVQRHAQIRFRRLGADRREEAIQEAIASACVSFQGLAAKGMLHVATAASLAKFAVKQVRGGRHVGGTQETLNDVFSAVAQRHHGFPGVTNRARSSVANGEGWLAEAIADKKASVVDLVWTKLDFADWLKTLTRRDQKIIAALARRERSSDVADRFGVSRGRISQLRRRYEWGWLKFQGEQAA